MASCGLLIEAPASYCHFHMNISLLFISTLAFPHPAVSGVYRGCSGKKGEYPVSGSSQCCCNVETMLLPEQNAQTALS